MHILLFGKNGQLGWELQRTLLPLGEVIAFGHSEADFSQPEGLRRVVREVRPQVIVNAAAYTDVDRAESEPDLAMKINAVAPGVLAEEARELDALLIHFSTDYVFDGLKGSPYMENDPPRPLNVYGESKLAGERVVQAVDGDYLILRTSWVYSLRGDNFVTKVLKWARTQRTLRIVDDQISNPTWARMLAEITGLLLARSVESIRDRKGLYQVAGEGYANRLEWAQKILLWYNPGQEEQITLEIQPAQTSDFPTPAQRPFFTALNCDRFATAFGLRLPPWEAALRMALVP